MKYKTIWTLHNTVASMKNSLHSEMIFIDYMYAVIKFLVLNDKNIFKITLFKKN